MTDEVTDAICFDMVVKQRDEARQRIEQLETLLKRLDDCFQRSAPLFGAQWCRSVHISDALIEDVRAALAGEKKDE